MLIVINVTEMNRYNATLEPISPLGVMQQSIMFLVESTVMSSNDSKTTEPPLKVLLSPEYDPYSNFSDDEYIDELVEYITPLHYEWVLIVLSSLVLVVGLLGNFLVCYVVYKNLTMQTVTNIFIVNLAIADFCVLLFCLPPTVIWDVTETWFFGSLPCKLICYFQTVAVSVSVLTLAAISVDRWYAICKPLKFKSTPKRAMCITVVIWAISIVLDIPEAIYLDVKEYNYTRKQLNTNYMTSCVATWSDNIEMTFTLVKFFMLFLLPLAFIALTYFQIIRVLWRKEVPHQGCRSRLNVAIQLQIQSRRKAAKMLVAVVVLFALFYLPVHTVSIVRIYKSIQNNGINILISQLSHLLIYANSAINPLIYNFMSGKFRREFKKAMFCSSKQNGNELRLHYRTTSTRTHTAL